MILIWTTVCGPNWTNNKSLKKWIVAAGLLPRWSFMRLWDARGRLIGPRTRETRGTDSERRWTRRRAEDNPSDVFQLMDHRSRSLTKRASLHLQTKGYRLDKGLRPLDQNRKLN